MGYEVYLHNVPKVSDDGKSIPIAANQTKEFASLDEAKKFAADQKSKFDRVVLMGLADEKQCMIERYMDGEHIVPEPKPAKEEPAAAEAAESEATEPAAAEETN